MDKITKVSIPEKREIPFEVTFNSESEKLKAMVSIPEKREIPFEATQEVASNTPTTQGFNP